jgi:hypothetical protein
MCVLIQSGWRDSGLRGSILCRCDAIPDDWIAQALSDAAHIYHLVGWSQQDAGKKRAQPMPVQKTTRVFLYPKLGGRPKEWRKLAGPCLHARAPRRMWLVADGSGRLSSSADAAATLAAVAPDTSPWVCLFSVHQVIASLTQALTVHTGSITPSS